MIEKLVNHANTIIPTPNQANMIANGCPLVKNTFSDIPMFKKAIIIAKPPKLNR
jgi:hypothetical protein